MKKFLTTLLCLFWLCAEAQTPAAATSGSRPYGDIDIADLKLTTCDFEPDANSMVLFDRCFINYTPQEIHFFHHKRIKIFNAAASGLGDIVITIPNNTDIEEVSNLKAETFNINNGKIETIQVGKKQVIKQKVDKWVSTLTFSFPAVKDGSVIEYSYEERVRYMIGLPDWHFQGKSPVRYSECIIMAPQGYRFKKLLNITQDLAANTDTVTAMANIHSLPAEPMMDSYADNLQSVSFSFSNFNQSNTWPQIGGELLVEPKYGQQLKIKLKGEDELLAQVKNLTTDEKIAFIFNRVRSAMDCQYNDRLFASQSLAEAWDSKIGNSTEINLILCRLLTAAGLLTCPVAVNSTGIGRIMPQTPTVKNLNKTVAYLSLEGGKKYVLDASDKDNSWNKTPFELLNTFGLYVNVEQSLAGLIFLEDETPAKEVVFVNAEISSDAQVTGTTQINSSSYNREVTRQIYKSAGEQKYRQLLTGGDNNLEITSFEIENIEKDSLPITQNISFKLKLTSNDDKYLYFNPVLFTSLQSNPFISEKRYSDIDFTFRKYYAIDGRFKEPAGYKLDVIPPGLNLVTPDKSIGFRRVAAEQDGFILVHYVIEFKRSYFLKSEYQVLRDFYKKMYEMLNEQIVLKKI